MNSIRRLPLECNWTRYDRTQDLNFLSGKLNEIDPA